MMKEEEERRSLLLFTTTRSKRRHSDSFTRFWKRKSSSRSLEDDASLSPALMGKTTSTLSRVMMILMFMCMFMVITLETKSEGEKGIRFQQHQHLGDTLNTTTDDIAENTSNNTSDKLTFTLYTACSPMDKVLPTLRGKGSDDINDDMKEPYDWFSRVKAKLVLKDDDENIGGNDFSFNRGIPMEQITCGEYRVATGLMKRGTAFGFALYEIPVKDDDNDVSSLGRLIHYENQRNDAYEFEPEGAVVVKDIGCLTTDPKRVDKRCPWGERGGVVGGYSSSIAEDEREHPFGMRECTYKYEYGDVTFYNRVFDGKQLEYVWGSCLESCPAFTKHPYCAAAATPTSPPIEEVEEKKEEEEEEESRSNQTSEVNDDEEEDEENEEEEFTCEDGHHVIADGETNSCGECPPGSFSFTPNDASCQLCPKGFFQPFGRSDRCEACPKGMYQDEEGQRFCKPCDGSEISPDDMTELKMEELHDEGVPIGGVAWKMVASATNDSPSSRLGVTKRRSSRREQNNSNRKLLGGGLFGKGGWFSDDDDENDINGDGVVDARDVIEREIEDARAKGKGAESKDQCVASSASPVIVVDDQDGTIATNDDKSTPIDVNVTSEMTKDRVIPMPTTPKVNVVVSDEAKEARKDREPEATFESAAQETPFPVNTLDAAAGNVSTKATEIDPEVIADEAATLKNSVRHEKELNDLLREKEVDDDDTIVDKKIVKEEAIIETFEKVNVKELEKIDQTLASVAAEEAATVKDASLSTSVDVEETKEDSTAETTTTTSSTPSSSSSCDETVRGEFGVGYRGCQTTTRTGKKCIDWSKQPFGSKYGVAHAKWSHQSQPDFMDENPRNYCRNPSASADGIWCYVDAQGGFDSCEPIKRFAAGLGIEEEEEKEVEEVNEQEEQGEQEDVFTIAAADRFEKEKQFRV